MSGAGAAAVVVVVACPDKHPAAADRHRAGESVVQRGVGGRKFEELLAGGHVEQIGRAGIFTGVIVIARADKGSAAADCHRVTEQIARRGVGGGKFEELLAGGCIEQIG